MYAELIRKDKRQGIKSPCGNKLALLEGRFIYDAFVIGAKADALYAAVVNAGQQAVVTPTYTSATKTMALVSTGASSIKYTLDGTDPRYSTSAISVATGANVDLTAKAGTTVTMKSVAFSATLFTSDVVTTTQAVAS